MCYLIIIVWSMFWNLSQKTFNEVIQIINFSYYYVKLEITLGTLTKNINVTYCKNHKKFNVSNFGIHFFTVFASELPQV